MYIFFNSKIRPTLISKCVGVQLKVLEGSFDRAPWWTLNWNATKFWLNPYALSFKPQQHFEWAWGLIFRIYIFFSFLHQLGPSGPSWSVSHDVRPGVCLSVINFFPGLSLVNSCRASTIELKRRQNSASKAKFTGKKTVFCTVILHTF